jgi:molybdopterin/thiamine biosynthesis adenylyltransferase/proteasome lid subunit RPN8/RPN11
MIEIVACRADLDSIRTNFAFDSLESCAILFANETKRIDGTSRLLVREILFPELDNYTKRESARAELNPEYVAVITKRARRDGVTIVFAHSHPGSNFPSFSQIDLMGEERLSTFLAHRHPNLTHSALVVSKGGMRARRLGTAQEIRIIELGAQRNVLFDPEIEPTTPSEDFDRQIRAFGVAGQKNLERLRIAVVGLGGTGSLVAQQLVHLGVRDFILVDPDVIESTNLNRVYNASRDDVGKSKVSIAARYISAVRKDAKAVCIEGDIVELRVAKELLNADFIFGCTDSHGSRAVLQQISYQYMIPCIDMGTTITTAQGRVEHIFGRVQLLTPGQSCFTCSHLLDHNEVRQDMMNAFERKSDPYILGAREPAPAVISLNGTVVSLGVTMLLSIVTGIPADGRHILYNAVKGSLRSVRAEPDPKCHICSRVGAFARGDSWPLFARQD